MSVESISLRINEQVAVLTIDRPPVNAVNIAVINKIDQTFDQLEKSDDVRVIVITGAGDKAFSAGLDIKDTTGAENVGNRGQEVWTRLFRFSKPLIAAINGYAFGGGCELALACDFRIMSDNPKAKIGLTEVDMGIIPGWGGTQFMTRLLGRKKALELILFGKRLTANEAFEIGLVDKVSAPGEVLDDALEFAEKLARRAPVSVSCVLRAVNAGMANGLEAGLKTEREGSRIVAASEDAKEGIAAFFEKREPFFKGK